jgi:hypothetical protein
MTGTGNKLAAWENAMALHKETKQVEQSYATCDGCGKRMDPGKTCRGCGKHVCRDCRVYWDNDPFSGADAGDYPEFVCVACDAAVAPYREQADAVNRECESKIEALKAAWAAACKPAATE